MSADEGGSEPGSRACVIQAAVPPDTFSERDIEFHRQTAALYDEDVTETFGVYHRYLLEPYLDHLVKRSGPGRALDLGCGTGVVSIALAARGFEVVGVDHSKEMLSIAERKMTDRVVTGSCRFLVGDVRNLPFEDGAFDCVTCQGLLHHLPEMESCLRELDRVLRPGGSFYISEPCRDPTPLRRALRPLWRLSRIGRRPRTRDGPESLEAAIAADELGRLLERLGLEFEMRFLAHIPQLRSVLPEKLYVLAVRGASFPWRRRKGDLVFVFGRKIESSAVAD